jgi:hypothetical protein
MDLAVIENHRRRRWHEGYDTLCEIRTGEIPEPSSSIHKGIASGEKPIYDEGRRV